MEIVENKTITPESVLLLIREMALSFDKQLKESQAERLASEARFDREIEKSRAEMAESRAEFDRRMKNLDDMIGGVSNSNGMFAEEFFFNALDMGDRQFFGEHFDDCYSLVKRYNKSNQKRSEHDILLVNGKSLAIVEVKYKARKEDVQKIINKIPDFRLLFPEYKGHRIFLGLAAMSFDKGVEEESDKAGIAIVKQVGDTVVINDEHLKTF